MNEAHFGEVAIPSEVQSWLRQAVDQGASDLHLAVGHPPILRLHGDLTALPGEPLGAPELRQILTALCPSRSLARLEAEKNIDFSFGLMIAGWPCRFRTNVFHAGGDLGACVRLIPSSIPAFEWANFPVQLAERIAGLVDGLVIVTGSAGSGKTTTLAMVVNLLNQRGGHRIISVEEPVEYIYPQAVNSVVTQREVGQDVLTFADGLRSGLRQDPDVILVGEIRDRETAQMVLSAAETGHLVFTTLHTRDAKGAISRYADLFPQEAQRDVRYQLAASLRAVVAQRLLPDIEQGGKRHLALEVLWNTNPIASSIRTGKLESIDNYLLTGRSEGMLSLDESVRLLFRDGLITRAVAEAHVRDVSMLAR